MSEWDAAGGGLWMWWIHVFCRETLGRFSVAEQLIPPPPRIRREGNRMCVRARWFLHIHPPPGHCASLACASLLASRGEVLAVLSWSSVVSIYQTRQGGKKNKIKNNNNKKAHRLCRQTWCTSDKMPHAFSAGRKPLHLSPSGVCRDSGCCSRALQQQQEQL